MICNVLLLLCCLYSPYMLFIPPFPQQQPLSRCFGQRREKGPPFDDANQPVNWSTHTHLFELVMFVNKRGEMYCKTMHWRGIAYLVTGATTLCICCIFSLSISTFCCIMGRHDDSSPDSRSPSRDRTRASRHRSSDRHGSRRSVSPRPSRRRHHRHDDSEADSDREHRRRHRHRSERYSVGIACLGLVLMHWGNRKRRRSVSSDSSAYSSSSDEDDRRKRHKKSKKSKKSKVRVSGDDGLVERKERSSLFDSCRKSPKRKRKASILWVINGASMVSFMNQSK